MDLFFIALVNLLLWSLLSSKNIYFFMKGKVIVILRIFSMFLKILVSFKQ